MAILQKAIELAVKAHRNAEDPPGEPYIVHPLRVLMLVSQGDDTRLNEHLRCVAVLHDSIERGTMTAKELRKHRMPKSVVGAIEMLTHSNDVTYANYIVKLKRNALARAVKIADLRINADLRRVTFRADKSKKDSRRVVRYAASYQFLLDRMTENQYRKIMKRAD